jgi:acetyl esterase/lipase
MTFVFEWERKLKSAVRAVFVGLSLFVAPLAATAAPMTVKDYFALTGPAPTAHIAYGAAPSQYAELFLPKGTGPFPVVFLVHGGCWVASLRGIGQMHNMAGDLQARGVAVWNVEYRRLDEPGGGYPGMYQDINRAYDMLVAKAPTYHLDMNRVVAMGHSAGGHLVQWLAGRARLPKSSPVYDANPVRLTEVVSLGGLADLRAQAKRIPDVCDAHIEQLTGPPSTDRPDPLRDTSAASLLPNGNRTVLINGALDDISPPSVAADYATVARRAGDKADVLVLPGASHFDEVAATSPAWKLTLPVILNALRPSESVRPGPRGDHRE